MPQRIPVFVVITAVLAWVNARYLKLPSTIGVMAAALLLSTATLLLGYFVNEERQHGSAAQESGAPLPAKGG
jgi:hypothetical protein